MTANVGYRYVRWISKDRTPEQVKNKMPEAMFRIGLDEDDRVYVFAGMPDVLMEIIASGKKVDLVFFDDGTPYVSLQWFYDQYPGDDEVTKMALNVEMTAFDAISK